MLDLDKTERTETLYSISVMILLLLGSMVIVPIVLLPFHITINYITMSVSIGLAAALYFLLFGVSKSSVTNAFLAALAVLVVLILIGSIFDVSYDGLAYQKAAIGALRDGWNPTLESIDVWAAGQPLRKGGYFYGIWIDHYPKATWYIGAGFYALTGNIESGKAYTILMMIACFGILFDFLVKSKLRNWQAFIVSLVAILNPLTMAQCTTFYNDAFLMLSLFVIVILLVRLFRQANRGTYLLLFFALVICTNIKLTGLAYAFVFSFFTLLLLIIYTFKQKKPLNRLLTSAALIFIGTVALATLGGPYIQNWKDHGNFLYPLIGSGSIDIITVNTPASFIGQPTFYKLFYSFFSYSEDLVGATIADPTLRIPFTLAPNELAQLGVADLRIGGFGPFFGPIIIISAVIILGFLFAYRKKNKLLFSILLLESALVSTLMLAISESWWARYSGYFYGIVVTALALCFWQSSQKKRTPTVILASLLSILALANTALFFPKTRLEKGAAYSQEILMLKNIPQDAPLSIYLGDGTQTYTGVYSNLIDQGVWFVLVPEQTEEMASALEGKLYFQTND